MRRAEKQRDKKRWTPGDRGPTMGVHAAGNRNAGILAAFLALKGKNRLPRSGERPGAQPGASANSMAGLELGAPQQPLLDATSSCLPLGPQKADFFPWYGEDLSCFDGAASVSLRNYQVPARRTWSTTPRERPGEPWPGPDHRYCGEFLRGFQHIPSHVDWLDARGRANFWKVPQPEVADVRSKRRKPRRSPFHWKGGAWPALPETASANQLPASRLF